MKTDFRNRAFLPIAIPLGLLAGMAAVIGLFAWILLYNTKEGALALAIVMATGILAAVAFAASRDELDQRRKAGVLMAGVVPVALGVVFAATGGGVDDDALLNINRLPHEVVPEVNVTIVATNSSSFESSSLTLPTGEVAVIFDNQESGVPHNWAYTEAGEGGTEPAALTAIGATAITAGPDENFLAFEAEAGSYWFWCQVHPNMNGLLTVAEGATPSAA